MSPEALTQLVTTGGPLAVVLAFFVVAFLKGWIVPGYIYRREKQEKGDLLNATLQSIAASRLVLETNQMRERDDAARDRDPR